MRTETLSIQSLRKAIVLKEKIEALNAELPTILGGSGSSMPAPFKPGQRQGMSAAGRAKIAAAAKTRWARVKAAGKADCEKDAIIQKHAKTKMQRRWGGIGKIYAQLVGKNG